MRLARRQKNDFVFVLTAQEKGLMLTLLEFFPQVPVAHHRLNQLAPSAAVAESQRLLEDSLAAHKAEEKEWVATTFQGPRRFQPVAGGFHLKVKRAEMERLLQIFNDLRVGSWLALNAPDLEQKRNLSPTRLTAPFIQRMELAGIFEMILLKALQHPGSV